MKLNSNIANTKAAYVFARMLSTILFVVLSSNICFSQEGVCYVDHYKTVHFDVAIFPPAGAFLIPDTPFTPSHSEIDKAEIALNKQLQKLNSQLINQGSSPVVHRNLKKYKRQYFGYTNKENERILFINCVWAKTILPNDEWLKVRIVVNDGGSYYWNIKYNIEKDELFDLDVNGEG